MQFGALTRGFVQRFAAWETAAKLAFALAVIILLAVMAVAATLPADQRWYGLVGIVGVVVVMQLIFMYANRGMVTAYTQAQRHYLEGDFASARAVLEADLRPGDYKSRTLLGNVLRQMGDLDKSEDVLTQALQIAPNHHFVLYGFGRTLLVKGMYTEATVQIQRALSAGAPPVVRVDYAEALYRQGAPREAVIAALDAAHPAAQAARDQGQAHHLLLVTYLLHQAGAGAPPDAALIAEGFAYWQASAERFGHTPYGAALRQDIAHLRALEG